MISFARTFALLYIASFLTACGPEPIKDEVRLAALVEAASTMFSEAGPLPVVLATHSYPEAIASLDPRSVRIEEAGVYVSMRRVHVRECGYFIPVGSREPITGGGSDPTLTLLAPNIYWYEIEG